MKTYMESNLRDDLITIKADVRNLTKGFEDFVRESKENRNETNDRLSELENTQARQGERISNWNFFQVAFSTIIGAIATYLGAKQ